MKKTYIVLIIVFVLAVLFLFFKYQGASGVKSYKDATYKIEGQAVTLKNGANETSIPNSSSKVVTSYFGNEAHGDFDGDGRSDVVFLLTQNSGGSGTFFYVVVALNKVTGYVGGEAQLIGDRISPQTTEVGQDGLITVNYADRAPGESFATRTSIGKSMRLLFDSKTLKFELLK